MLDLLVRASEDFPVEVRYQASWLWVYLRFNQAHFTTLEDVVRFVKADYLLLARPHFQQSPDSHELFQHLFDAATRAKAEGKQEGEHREEKR